MTTLLDGKALSKKLLSELQKELSLYSSAPHLVVFKTYPHVASEIYVRNKVIACGAAGIRTTVIETQCSSEAEIIDLLAPWNTNPEVDGILIQTPFHPAISPQRVMAAVNPDKDVDGTHPLNLGKLVLGCSEGFIPCTPLGILTLLNEYGISTKGKHAVIVGRSCTVGKPLALLLSRAGVDATVSLANRSTHNLGELCRSADILVAAAGSPNLIRPDMVKQGAVVIDVGINRLQKDGKDYLVGDVDFAQIHDTCSAITPVPGGIGPMTVASLLQNTALSYCRSHPTSCTARLC